MRKAIHVMIRVLDEVRSVDFYTRAGSRLAKFFFVQDPNGYRIEILQKHGRYR